MLFEFDGCVVERQIDDGDGRVDDWRVNLNLTNVCVTSILMVGKNGDLDQKGTDGRLVVLERNHDPTVGFMEFHVLDLLQIMKMITDTNGNSKRSVRFVQFVVCVDAHVLDQHLLLELDVDQVRLGPVRLPIRFQAVVAQLIHTEACDARENSITQSINQSIN